MKRFWTKKSQPTGAFTDGFRPPRGSGATHEDDVAATAFWTPADVIRHNMEFVPGKSIFLGCVTQGGYTIYVGAPIDDRHGITVAGSRSGKGTSFIVPNLLFYPGSVIANDPKAELAMLTAQRRRAMGQSVAIIDPFRESGLRDKDLASFNVMDIIDADHEDATDEAGLLADALIVQEGGKDNHWTQAAKNLLHGVIMAVAFRYPKGDPNRTLVKVRELITQDADAMLRSRDLAESLGEEEGMLSMMMAAGGFAEQVANGLQAKADAERSGVLSTAQEQTAFLYSPAMKRALGASSFSIDELKTNRNGCTVYLCLPARRMGTHARFLRLMITVALARMEAVKGQPQAGYPVLFMLDEFAALGHMKVIERAAGLMAGYGVKLWTVLQDLTQLKRDYKESWETFLGNAGTMQFFGNSDATTCRYVSEMCGKVETIVRSFNELTEVQRAQELTGIGHSTSLVPLIHPDEVRRLFSRKSGKQLIQFADSYPLALERVRYFDPAHGALFDPALPEMDMVQEEDREAT